MKLDIGCGNNKRPGFMGMDKYLTPQSDIVWDWEVFPWPFDDNSTSEINATHVLEHTKDLIKFMDECYRILKKKGTMFIVCPYYTSIGDWQDQTHTRAFSEKTLDYFNKNWRIEHGLNHYHIKSDFDFTYIHIIEDDYSKQPVEAINFAIRHFFNVCREIHATLIKK